MFRQSIINANRRELAKKLVVENVEFKKFKNSEYFLPNHDKVLEAIGLLSATPEKERTSEDNALLLDFYQHAGYIKIKPEYLSNFQFDSGLTYREKAVALQRKMFATKRTVSEETILATMLWQLSIAYFKQSKSDCSKAMTTLTEAIGRVESRKVLTSADLENLIQFHETATQITLSTNFILETHAHYQTIIRYIELLNKTLPETSEQKDLNLNYLYQIRTQMQNLWRKNPEVAMKIADQLLAAQEANKLLQEKIHDLEKNLKQDNIGNVSHSLPKALSNGSKPKSDQRNGEHTTTLVNNWYIPRNGGLR